MPRKESDHAARMHRLICLRWAHMQYCGEYCALVQLLFFYSGAIVVGTGGWGLLAIGTSVKPEGDQTTYDCWKPVVHDKSEDPSDGILMKDLVSHPHVAKVTITEGICTDLPHIILENVWKEMFEIEYLLLHDTGKIVCHAKPVL